jgi:hypothetical protein
MATVRPDQAGLDSYVDPGKTNMGGSVAGVKATTTMLVVAVSISRLSPGQRTHCAVRTSIRKLAAELKMELRPEQLYDQNQTLEERSRERHPGLANLPRTNAKVEHRECGKIWPA